MNCNNCCYNLPKDGHSYCTYEDGECVKISILEKENAELKADLNEKENTVHTLDVLHKEAVRKYGEVNEQLTKAKEIIEELSKSLFLAKGIVKDLIDDTVDYKESKARAMYCYKQKSFDAYKVTEQFLKENEKHHYEAEVINGKLTGKAILVPDNLAYVKSIVKDLLDNSDEYAKQRAREFLEEK